MINLNDEIQNNLHDAEVINQDGLNSEFDNEKQEQADSLNPTENYKEKFEDLQNRFLRLYADFENHKREVIVQRSQDERKYRKQIILTVILPLLDHLKLATDYAPKTEDPALVKYLQSVENILKTSIEDVKKVGAQVIIPNVGDLFDEKTMEVIQIMEHDQTQISHTILKVVSFGLIIEDIVISPAKVIISA